MSGEAHRKRRKTEAAETEFLRLRVESLEHEAAALAELHLQAVAERDLLRGNQDAAQNDLAAILSSLGLGDHARPISPHEIVEAEILPAIAALRITCEEGGEIEGELTAALAVLAGESLKPCMPPCPGHLGPNANAAVNAALKAWRALHDGNAQAAARIAELTAQLAEKDAALALAGEALQWMSRMRAATVFVETAEHVADFFKRADAALEAPALARAVELDKARREVVMAWRRWLAAPPGPESGEAGALAKEADARLRALEVEP